MIAFTSINPPIHPPAIRVWIMILLTQPPHARSRQFSARGKEILEPQGEAKAEFGVHRDVTSGVHYPA